MGKRTRTKRGKSGAGAPASNKPSKPGPKATTSKPDKELAQNIEALVNRAESLPVEVGESTLPDPPAPAHIDLAQAYQDASRAQRAYEAAKEELDRQKQSLETLRDELHQRQRSLEERELELHRRVEAIAESERELALSTAEVGRREQDLCKRELNAVAGFDRERVEMLAKLEPLTKELRQHSVELQRQLAQDEQQAAEQQRTERQRHARVLAQERLALDEELRQRRAECLRDCERLETERVQRLDQRERDLDAREADLQKDRAENDRVAQRQRFEQMRLAGRAEELDHRIEQGVSDARERFEQQRVALESRLEVTRKHNEELDNRLREYEALDNRVAGRTRLELTAELEDLRVKLDELRNELATRPSAEEARELQRQAKDADELRAERRQLLEDNARLERRVSDLAIAEQRLESIRSEHGALETSASAHRKTIGELRTQLDDIHALVEAKTAFPQCSAMDSDRATPQPARARRPAPALADIVAGLQGHMAEHSQRYYTLEDLRAFVGGLAMSRLLLLQGISGTGKTSLPIAFARAVGTEPIVIEVEAGWRDPQDLIGHYNTFEKRFHESELLQGLYRAQTPRFRDAIHIVVLDEMNLAHPEQYFSDFLSVLERDPEDRLITLTNHRLPSAPRLLSDGRKLKLLPNVWFVGTANHDETTKGFADKTCDRAHIMSLPHRPPSLDSCSGGQWPGLDYPALRDAFEAAWRTHERDASRALGCLEQLRPRLNNEFRIGWGPRLEQQVRRYVPVVVAAGGTVAEAADHILATRALRKLAGRYDNRIEHLRGLRDDVLLGWSGLSARPTKSMKILERELRRLDLDAADEVGG